MTALIELLLVLGVAFLVVLIIWGPEWRKKDGAEQGSKDSN